MKERVGSEAVGAFDDVDEQVDARLRERLGDRLDALVPDAVKRLALAGMGAVFMTEEGIRNVVTDLKLPREVVTTLLTQTEKARSELFRMIAVELRRFLEEANLAGELRKVLVGLSIDVQARVSFSASDDGRVEGKVESLEASRAPGKPRKKPKGRAPPRRRSRT